MRMFEEFIRLVWQKNRDWGGKQGQIGLQRVMDQNDEGFHHVSHSDLYPNSRRRLCMLCKQAAVSKGNWKMETRIVGRNTHTMTSVGRKQEKSARKESTKWKGPGKGRWTWTWGDCPLSQSCVIGISDTEMSGKWRKYYPLLSRFRVKKILFLVTKSI